MKTGGPVFGGAVYIKEERARFPSMNEFLRGCIPADELDACELFGKIIAKEPQIVAFISRVQIKAIDAQDKMKELMKGILIYVGETVKYNVKPYTSTVEFKIMETIVLNVFLHTAWYDLKSISLPEFLQKYPKLAALQSSEKIEERREFETIYKFRNVLCVATMLVPPKNNKERLISLTTRIVEGLGADGQPIRYVNGSGKTKGTKIRHDVFEQEMVSNFESRNEGVYDARQSVLKDLKRKYEISDPEPPAKRGKGRPQGSKNKKDIIALAYLDFSDNDFPIHRVKVEKVDDQNLLQNGYSDHSGFNGKPAQVYIKQERNYAASSNSSNGNGNGSDYNYHHFPVVEEGMGGVSSFELASASSISSSSRGSSNWSDDGSLSFSPFSFGDSYSPPSQVLDDQHLQKLQQHQHQVFSQQLQRYQQPQQPASIPLEFSSEEIDLLNGTDFIDNVPNLDSVDLSDVNFHNLYEKFAGDELVSSRESSAAASSGLFSFELLPSFSPLPGTSDDFDIF